MTTRGTASLGVVFTMLALAAAACGAPPPPKVPPPSTDPPVQPIEPVAASEPALNE